MTDRASISFTAHGTPQQVGSKRAFVVGTRAVISDTNGKKSKEWATLVREAARQELPEGWTPDAGPILFSAHYYFPRPKSHYGTGRNAGKLKGSAPHYCFQGVDCDKLDRCIRDSLSGVVYRDDRQICCGRGDKHWTTGEPRAEVTIVFLSGDGEPDPLA